MTTDELVNLHLERFGRGDVAGLLSEYHDDVVFFTPTGMLRGVDAIRPLFEAMISEFSMQGVTFELLTRQVGEDYAYLAWKAETPLNSYQMGADTMHYRDGKIAMQSAALAITPKR
jgi:ketosteroid isomerase-like protein